MLPLGPVVTHGPRTGSSLRIPVATQAPALREAPGQKGSPGTAGRAGLSEGRPLEDSSGLQTPMTRTRRGLVGRAEDEQGS